MKINNYRILFLVLASLLLSFYDTWGQTISIQQPVSGTPISCFGATDGVITVTIDTSGGGVLPPFNYTIVRINPATPLITRQVSSSELAVAFTNLPNGIYVVAVEDDNQVSDDTQTIVSNRNVVNTVLVGGVTNPVCFNAATGSFTVRGSGGTNTVYNFEITGPSFPTGSGFVGSGTNAHIFTSLLAGTYSVVARDANNCIDPTPLTVVVSQPTQVVITLSSTSNPLCVGNANGNIAVAATGGTAPYQYSINGGTFGSSGTFSGLTAGTYEITVRDNRGCIERLSGIVLTDPPVLQVTLDSQTDILGCFGESSGQIQVSATGGTAPYTYSRDGVTFAANNGLFTNLPAGTYNITVRDANGCTIVLAPVTLSQPNLLTAVLQTQTDITDCFAQATGQISVTATGGTTPYQYSRDNGGSFQASPTFTGLVAGNYTILVRDARGCTATVTNITLTQPTQVNLSLSNSQNPLCKDANNGSVTVSASGGQPGYTYSINGGAFQASNVFMGLTAGTYTVTVRDSKNCESTLANISLSEPDQLLVAVTARQDVQNCFGDNSGQITVSATGGTSPYQYSRDNGSSFQASPTFTGLVAGNYTILVRDANNCTATATPVTLSQPPVLALSIDSQANITGCFGDVTGSITVSATGGTPGYEYSRNGSTFQTSPTFTGLTAGAYTITVRDSRGCTATVNATLTQPIQLTASLTSQTNILCFGQTTGAITVGATGGTAPYEYSRNGTDFVASNLFTGLAAGTYTITIRDSRGCTAQVQNITITQTAAPLTASVTAQQNISCAGGSNGSINVTATGGTAPYTYSRDGINFVANNGAFTGLTAGTYTIMVRDANNCTVTLPPVTLTEPVVLQATLAATTSVSCNGGNNGSATISATGGTSPYQYSRDNGSNFQPSPIFNGLVAGNYTILVRDANGCTVNVPVTISQPTVLALSTTTSNVSCNGAANGSATVTTSGGTASYSYSWNTAPVQTTATATGLAPGSYTVTVTDANGCTQTANVTITQPPVVAAPVAGSPAPICTGQAIPALTATGSNLQWYSDAALTTLVGSGNSFTPAISNTNAGTTTFYVTQTVGGCTSTATIVSVVINATPTTPIISGTLTFCAGGSTTLTSSATSANQWLLNGNPISGATNQTLTVSAAGNYTVQTTANGCTSVSAVATVTQITVPVPTISGTLTFCADGNTTLTSSAASGNQWLLNGNPIAGATNQTLSVTTAGNYSVVVTVSGCTATSATATLNQTNVTPPVAANPGPICTGQSVPTLTATGSNIQWYRDAALSDLAGSGNSFTPTINNTIAGNTIFYVTQTSGSCQSTATQVTVTINQTPPKPTISGALAFCTGGNTILTSSAATGNQWLLNGSPISGATNQTLVVTAAGDYSVIVTSASCSATSDPVAVTVTSTPAPTISASAPICTGQAIPTLTATGSNLQWYSNAALTNLVGSGNSFTPAISNTNAGTTTFYVTQTVGGCTSAAASVSVVINTTPATPTISGTLTFCVGSSTTLTSSVSAGNQWFLNGNPIPGATNQTLTVSAAGNYTVQVTANGCTATSSVASVSQNSIPTPTIAGTLTFCTGGNTILTSSAASGNQWLLNGSPITGATNPTLTVTTAGNYSVIVTVDGCSVTSAAVAVTESLSPAPVAASPAPICTSDAVAPLTASGTAIKWYSNAVLTNQIGTGDNFTPTLDNTVAGNTIFYVTQTINGCESAATQVTVTINARPTAPTISGNLTFCAGSNTILTSNAAAGNQWLLNGNPISGATNQTFTVSAAGNYSVTVTSGSCSATSNPVTVTQSTLDATLTASNANCANPNSGVITINATGGLAPYSYSLDGTNFANTSGVFGGLAPDNYTVFIRDASGCVITRAQTITAVTGITAVILTPANETACSAANGTITVSGITGAAGPYEYYINGVANTAGINNNVFAGLQPGSYTIRIAAANGCDFTGTVVVGMDCINCQLTASVVSQANPTCVGNDGRITLTSANGTGTVTYSIDGGTNFNTNPVFNNLVASSYTIVVKDANNCIVNAGTVTLNPAVAITATVSGSNPSTCGVNNGTITVSDASGGTAPYQYSIDGVNYQTSSTFTGLAGNSYTVYVRDVNNCVATYTQAITAPNGISTVTVNTISESGCSASDGRITVTASGGTTPYQYYINGVVNPAGATNNIFTALTGGVYSIRVETADGCFFTTTASVGTNCTTPCTLAATLTTTDILCRDGNNGQITLSVTGGTGLYEYSLNGTDFQPTAVFNTLTAGNYTVTIRDRNNPSCRITRTATLTNPPAITGSITASSNSSCQNNDGSITVSASGGTGALQYAVNGGTFSNNPVFSNLSGGLYSVSARDANNCIATIGSVTLTTPPAITASVSKIDPSGCSATDGQLTVSNVLNGTAPFEYSIDGVNYQTSPTFTGLGIGTYIVQVRDGSGCRANLNPVTLQFNVTITATVTPANPSSCTVSNGTITISNVTGGTAPYQYSIGGAFQSGNVFSNLPENIYAVTIRDANGCLQALTPVTLTAPNSITAIALSATDETTCNARNGQITVSSVTGGTAPYQYFINGAPNPAGPNNNVFAGLAAGSYTIRVVSADGCEYTSSAVIQAACCLEATITAQANPTCKGNDGSITINATGGSGTIRYSIDGGLNFVANPVFSGLTAGTYNIIVRDDVCQRTVGAITLTTVPLTATVTSTDPSGCSATNGQIVITDLTGGTAPYQYSLDGVNYVTNATFANLSSGNYTVFAKEASGCVITFSRTLAPTGGILSVETTTVSESGCNTSDGQITVTNVIGVPGPYQYFIDRVLNPAGASNNVFAGLASGPHQVRVVAPNGCDFVVNVVIGSNCTNTCILTASVASQSNPTCVGNDGVITVSAANGTGTIQYSINNGTTFVASPVFNGLPAATYTILVRDAAGCQTSVSATLTLPAVITAVVTGTNPTGCTTTDGTITISNVAGGTAPYEYSKDETSFQTGAVFTNLSSGSYTLTVRDAAGCTATFSQSVTSPAGSIIANTTVQNETACNANNGQITVNASGASGAVEYYINGVANPAGINSNVFASLSPATYSIRVRDAAGCEFTTTATVTKFECPVTCNLVAQSSYSDPNCTDPNSGFITITVTGGTQPYEYSLNGAAFAIGNGRFTNIGPGRYDIQVKDANGCLFTLTPVNLVFPSGPNNMLLQTSNPTSCSATDGVIEVTDVFGGTVPYQYSINGGGFRNRNRFTGLAPGSYLLEVKDAKGCIISQAAIINAPGSITANTTVQNETACNANNGQITVNASGASGAVEYYINGVANPAGINNNVFASLSPATYSIRVRDAAGCEFTTTATVTKFDCPDPVCTLTATTTVVQPTCTNPTSGSITVTPVGGTAPFQYAINNGAFASGIGVFNGLNPGTYNIIVRDANSCDFTLTPIVLNDPAVVLTVNSTNPASCVSNDGTLTATASGGNSPYRYSLDGVDFTNTSGVFTGLAAGNYTVFVQDAPGCIVNQSRVLTAPGGITGLTLNPTSETGCGAVDGTILVNNITGATGPYQYYINGLANPAGINTSLFSGLSAATYTIRVVAANGCEFTTTASVGTNCTTPCTLAATVSGTDVTSCSVPNGTITITSETGGTAPYQYSKDGINFQATNVFTNLAAGSYTIRVRDASGCSFSRVVVISAPAGFTATLATTNETSCRAVDGSITVSVTGGTAPFRYYINGVENLAGSVFGSLAPNSYTIRVTDANNCEFTAAATINSFTCPPPVCTITAQAFSNPVLCNGVNDGTAILINISGGSGNYEFSIDNGVSYQANPQFNSLAAGNYTILVRDQSNATCTASFPVAVATRFDVAGIIIVNQPRTCGEKGRITFTNVFGGQAPYQFSVNGTTFVADTAFANLNPGRYRATIRDSKGCQFSANIDIIGGEAITATVTQGQQASCGRADGTIAISNVSGGSGVFVYSLNGTDFSGATTFTGLAAGAYTVYIREQNGSCIATFPATITAAQCCQLTVTPVSSQPTSCSSTDGTITVNVTAGVAPLTYRLNNGLAQNSNVFGGLGNGSYIISVTDANGCQSTVSVLLASPNALTAQAEQVLPVSCFGEANGTARIYNVVGGSNNINNYEYSLDGIIYQNSPLFTRLRAGIYILYVRDRVVGCVASYPVTVNEATQITATVTPVNPSVCTAQDGSINIASVIGGAGSYQYSLDSLTGYQVTPRFSNLGNGTYKVYIKDTRGCMAVYPVRLSSPNAINVASPTLINPTCQGSNNGQIRIGTVTGGQAPYQYSINGGAYESSGVFNALPAGTYTVRVKDQSGCEYPFTYTLTEPATIVFEVVQTKEVTCTDPTGAIEVNRIVGGTQPYSFSLNNRDFQPSPVFPNLSPDNYTMYVRDASVNTCSSSKPFTIRGARAVTYEVLTTDVGCSGTDKGSITIQKITGGIVTGLPVEYRISINNGTTFRFVTTDNATFNDLEAGIYNIVIEYGAGCRTAARRVVINPGSIPFNVTATPATCGASNGSASVAITNPIPGKVYYYSMDSLNFFTTPNFPNLRSGTYKMFVRESLVDNCPNMRRFTVPGPDSVRYVIRRQDCNTMIVDNIRGGVAPYVITINGRESRITGEIFQNRYVFTDLRDGQYVLTITDSEGCSTFPFNFRVGNAISYKVKTTPSVIEKPTGQVLIYDIAGGQPPYEVSLDGQQWDLIKDRSIPIDTLVKEVPTGLVTVYIRDANGCIKPMTTEITELKFVVPNIFTPNGDGINDTFFITKLPPGTFVKIIDRWGKVAFETRDYKNDWDGGQYPDGVYYYTIDIAGEQTYKGWVQIWR